MISIFTSRPRSGEFPTFSSASYRCSSFSTMCRVWCGWSRNQSTRRIGNSRKNSWSRKSRVGSHSLPSTNDRRKHVYYVCSTTICRCWGWNWTESGEYQLNGGSSGIYIHKWSGRILCQHIYLGCWCKPGTGTSVGRRLVGWNKICVGPRIYGFLDVVFHAARKHFLSRHFNGISIHSSPLQTFEIWSRDRSQPEYGHSFGQDHATGKRTNG